jgi:hypothetical protein
MNPFVEEYSLLLNIYTTELDLLPSGDCKHRLRASIVPNTAADTSRINVLAALIFECDDTYPGRH